MLKFSDWINRIRHNRGFGIQSPTAFFFVTQVLKEKLPYYAYKEIDNIAEECGTHSKKMCRRIFRIANYLHPESIIAIGAEATAPLCAIAAAASNAKVFFITEESKATPAAGQFLKTRGCNILQGDKNELLQKHLHTHAPIHLLYIGINSDIASTLQTALLHTDDKTVIIVDDIHKNHKRLKQWEAAVKSPKTIVTYDMYSMGILFFDNAKQKQHYTLKM